MRGGTVAMVGALVILTACKDKDRAKAAPVKPPTQVPLPTIDARWTVQVAARRFLVITADGDVRGGAWTGDPGEGMAIAELDEHLSERLDHLIAGAHDTPDEAPPPEEEPPPEEPPEEEPEDDGGTEVEATPPTAAELAEMAQLEQLAALDGEGRDYNGWGFGRASGSIGGTIHADAAPRVDPDLQHGAAGLVVRDPRPDATLVLAAPTALATTLIVVVDALAALDDTFIGVTGPTGAPALAVRFRSNGSDTTDDAIPLVALGADGASVRRTDSKPTGTAIWTGGRIDAAALVAAHQAAIADVVPAWRGAVMITVEPTITVAQLLDVVTVLVADGVTAVGLLDFAPPWHAVVVGEPEGPATMKREHVYLHLRAESAAMASCYEHARAKAPELAGTVELAFRIEPTGYESHVHASGPPALAKCAELRAIEYPFHRPKGGVAIEVTVPIVFRLPP